MHESINVYIYVDKTYINLCIGMDGYRETCTYIWMARTTGIYVCICMYVCK